MGRIVMEYDVERIYLAGAPPLQVYFRKEETSFVERLRKIAEDKSQSVSQTARELLCESFKVKEDSLVKELKRRKGKKQISLSRIVRDALIDELKNGGQK